jgi:carbon monoxide dehydrogenase subunit G
MASIRKEVHLDAPAEPVWDAIRDFAHVHTRVVPGFVTGVQMDGPDVRVVTFANGSQARELLVDSDDHLRRLVYAIKGDQMIAHSASVQVLDDGGGRSLLIWTTDVLPHELATYISGQMDEGVKVMKPTLERQQAKARAQA